MHRLLALGAPEYVLEREQWVPASLETAFDFFVDPYNLPRITPPWLGFQIVRLEPPVIQAGTLIDYRLKWFGVPYFWQTLIEAWEPGVRFVDTQKRGPYILWHHTHTFATHDEGVLLSDRVRYRLPFGPLGALLHTLLVRRQLEAIFDYRAEQIAALLSGGTFYRAAPPEAALTGRR
ncbi:MAG TPA: SRPBCC family protein [Chthonomonadaceae bacterium]|nr:SRPBCC family protein [Chthonomonadaceae bacterium]